MPVGGGGGATLSSGAQLVLFAQCPEYSGDL